MLRELGKEYICRLSDVDLVEYIQTGTRMYLPEAIEYAQVELERRKLTPVQLCELDHEANQRIAAKVAMAIESNSRPLGWGGKLAAFLIGLCGGFHFILHMLAEDRPQTRRAEDWQKFERIGFIGLFVIGGIIGLAIAIVQAIKGNPLPK